jgi:hypothetical protein
LLAGLTKEPYALKYKILVELFGVIATLRLDDNSCKAPELVSCVLDVKYVLTTCNTTPDGNLADANVPDEILVAFKDVSDAPDPLNEVAETAPAKVTL